MIYMNNCTCICIDNAHVCIILVTCQLVLIFKRIHIIIIILNIYIMTSFSQIFKHLHVLPSINELNCSFIYWYSK